MGEGVNLVPRVSLPDAFGGKKRDPGNEVGSRLGGLNFPLPLSSFDSLWAFPSYDQFKLRNVFLFLPRIRLGDTETRNPAFPLPALSFRA